MQDLTFKTRAELWLAGWFQRFYRWRARPLEEIAPQRFAAYETGSPEERSDRPPAGEIPSVIWAYWNGAQPPLLIQRCFENWRRFNPDFRICILNDETLPQYLPEVAAHLGRIPVAKRSDWIRLELLYRHGGIWLDASTILTESLEWVGRRQLEAGADFVGYYLEQYTTRTTSPVVESWFMAAPAGSAFIGDALREFVAAAIPRSGAEYVAYLRERGSYDQLRQNIDIPEYLSIHLAMQVVLQGGGRYRLCLGKAEDGPYALHVLGKWGRTPLKIRLFFSRVRGELPSLIKLRSPDRKRLDQYLLRQLYVKDSIADRFLR
ncbi:hypothetical protein GCM10007205_04870 [Oxalicibacterium flavum]|uniref:Mannosyltransferase n=1 Tax=Oxalicibacterium flavum TaxID=179467 RepID=A0A8J2UP87_9BURK|nr:capsular polysaccharide synthesis protein [Oxalicibacterium flavum]GGB98585.1 hypothetical protein GCM10007205_04870 [Oxalicibacterium flavum]